MTLPPKIHLPTPYSFPEHLYASHFSSEGKLVQEAQLRSKYLLLVSPWVP